MYNQILLQSKKELIIYKKNKKKFPNLTLLYNVKLYFTY